MAFNDVGGTVLGVGLGIPGAFIGTSVGTLFAPTLTSAAGGVGTVLGATAVGFSFAFIPTVIFSGMAAMSSSPVLKLGFGVMAAVSAVAGIALSAALFGIAAKTLLPAIAVGVAIAALGALLCMGLGKMAVFACAEGMHQTFTAK